MNAQPPRYLIIANPGGKRCEAFQRDLAGFWEARARSPEVEVVPWREVVPRDGNLDGLGSFKRPAVVRLESPGKDFDVARLLLRAGARQLGDAEADWLDAPAEKGRQVRPGLLYRGLRRTLGGLKQSFAERSWLRLTACPEAIAELFDKNATSARLAAAQIPVPDSMATPDSPQRLIEELRLHGFATAYVKLNTGSSASCMAVVHALADPPWAWSSLRRWHGGFYSTRRLCRYDGAELESVLAFLLEEGACVQRGVAMAQIDGRNFDVRVVMIQGEPAFQVFRLSDLPITNLHFGGQRGRFELCRAAVPTRAWLDALDHCREAARLYACDTMGIDLLFERGSYRHFILEINAFGDFFPGLRDESGRSVHAVEIEAQASRDGWPEPPYTSASCIA